MATSELVRPGIPSSDATAASRLSAIRFAFSEALAPFASLRLTVVLFALSIFLVFAGTLAQVDHDVWDVVNHTLLPRLVRPRRFRGLRAARADVLPQHPMESHRRILFPRRQAARRLLLVNLFAAHAVRFKVAASGTRLARRAGASSPPVLLITALVIRSGMNDTIESELSPAFCNGLWHALRATLAGIALVGAYLLVLRYGRGRPAEWWLLLAVDLPLAAVAVWLFLNPGGAARRLGPAHPVAARQGPGGRRRAAWPAACWSFASGPASCCCTPASRS